MKPQTIGRVLGIGVRVAGRMAGQRLAGATQAASGNSSGGTASRPVTIDAIARPAAGATGKSRYVAQNSCPGSAWT